MTGNISLIPCCKDSLFSIFRFKVRYVPRAHNSCGIFIRVIYQLCGNNLTQLPLYLTLSILVIKQMHQGRCASVCYQCINNNTYIHTKFIYLRTRKKEALIVNQMVIGQNNAKGVSVCLWLSDQIDFHHSAFRFICDHCFFRQVELGKAFLICNC